MTAFDDLIADPFAEKRYLAALEPYDPAPGRTTALHVGDHGFATGPADDPPNRYFEPRLVSALNFERRMFRGGRLGGRSIPGYGALELNNADGGIDAWAGYAFDGRRVRVWLGGAGFAFADYGLVFDGAAEGIEFDDTVARIPLRDGRRRFQRPIQASVYAGTGAMEGGDALKGKPKPLVFGRAFAVEPVPVDPARLVYQVHDGPIEDIDACRDRGLALDRTASSPEAGEFSVDKAKGTLTLGAAPAGTLTADVRGDKAGGAYVETAGALIRRIAVARGGLADPDDFDAASFAALEAAATAPVGVHVRTETEIQAVFDTLIEAAGGHYGFDRAGRLAVGRLDAPSAAVAARFGAAEILGLERAPAAPPIWRQRIGYRRHHRPLSGGETAGAVAAADRADLAEAYRLEEAARAATRTAHLLAEDDRRDTALALKADAAAEASRLLDLFGTRRDLLRVRVKTQPFALELGQSVSVSWPRHGLSAGRAFVVVGMVEDSAVNEVVLDLWG